MKFDNIAVQNLAYMKRCENGVLLVLQLLFILFPCTNLFSQEINYIGITIAADVASSGKPRPLAGVSFERMVNKHNSAEIGICYRTAVDDNLIIIVPSGANSAVSEQFFVIEKFVSIPLVYNYKSNSVNMSIGVSADFYTGWRQQKYVASSPGANLVKLQTYHFDHKLLWGAIAKISKAIRIDNKLSLEPYVYCNPVFTSYSIFSNDFSESRQYFGLALSIKIIL
jgi:tetrahydromethanopterin S-methyltransferase subunit D